MCIRDSFSIVGQRVVHIFRFHLDRCSLFVDSWVFWIDLDCFAEVVDGILKLLVRCSSVSTLLINSREIWRVFVVEGRRLTKQVDCFVPLLVLGGLCAV